MQTSLIATLVLSSIPIESIEDIRTLTRLGIVSKRWYRGSVDALRVLLPGVANRQAEALATRKHLLTLLPDSWTILESSQTARARGHTDTHEPHYYHGVEKGLVKKWHVSRPAQGCPYCTQ